MTTKEFLQWQIRRTELAIRRAERKPNAPAAELRGLREKLDHLQVALEAVEEHWRRVHQERGWSDNGPAADVRPVVHGRFVHDGTRFAGGVDWWHCSNCGSLVSGVETRFAFCPHCGADMRPKNEGMKNEDN
ncbi:hypothetical protein JQM64_08660 [Fournierella massiliensis]|nr:zinc ribbon domain-containing protein [Fournierella massiliensis]MCF2557584.1 hypothetical protein [Fournierella massiliensis]